MKKSTSILFWVLAVVLTLVISVYQRLTGPTYPVRGSETFNDKEVSYKLIRSQTVNEPIPVKITAPDPAVKAFLNYKHYKSDEPWKESVMKRGEGEEKDLLIGEVPAEVRFAAKVEYTVRVEIDGESFLLEKGKSIVARFKGAVPAVFLILHILFMFFSIIFALRTGMEALHKDGKYDRLVNWTLGITCIGGLILGPIVQKYAFGDLWTGFPFGTDLTDNKVLIAVICWVLAFFLKKKSKWVVIAATIVMIGIYLIPHSVLGSELDYKTGQMKNKYSIILKHNIRNHTQTKVLL
jgi:hypothetical protein